MRAAIYCRISRDRREVSIDGEMRMTMLGVERQEADCREQCAVLGWEVVEVFVDNDVSATSGKRRPAYEAMIAAVEAGNVDAIVCWHPDRLYRRVADLESLIAMCDKHRIPIATVNAGAVDLTTPTGRLVAGLLAQVNKYEGEHKAERWVRSFRQRREAGAPTGGGTRMFGWSRQGVIIEAEAAAIRKAAKDVLHGYPLAVVAENLNQAGLRTTKGNVWSTHNLRKLLDNPRLAGWTTMYGEVVSKSTWPPILDEAMWQAVTEAMSRNARTISPRVAWLRGVVRCGPCGSDLVTSQRSSGRRARTYRCPNGCVEVAADLLEAHVEEAVMDGDPWPADVRTRSALVREAVEGVFVDPMRATDRGDGTFHAERIRVLKK